VAIDLERLLKLRVVVGRIGEMDRAQWWNTRGQLGSLVAAALKRGLPRTHYFAQARSVFAVASHRCAALFDPPGAITLWRLPSEIEVAFEAHWEHWLDAANDWSAFFGGVAALERIDLGQSLKALHLIDANDLKSLTSLKTAAEGKAVLIPTPFSGTDADVTQLALGFALGRAGAPTVPYAKVANS